MGDVYTIADLQAVANQLKDPPPCDVTMRVKVMEAVDGVARGVWDVDERFINGYGIAMGGFVGAAVDIMMAYAIASKLTVEESFASIDLDTTFHRPTLRGEVEITATVERRGRTIAYVTADVVQKGKLAASCVSSFLIVQNK